MATYTKSGRSEPVSDKHITVNDALKSMRRPQHQKSGNFPRHPQLTGLLAYLRGGDGPPTEPFSFLLFRRQARELRRYLFGPEGLNQVADAGDSMTFDLGKGWTLCLTWLRQGCERDDLPEGFEISTEWQETFELTKPRRGQIVLADFMYLEPNAVVREQPPSRPSERSNTALAGGANR